MLRRDHHPDLVGPLSLQALSHVLYEGILEELRIIRVMTVLLFRVIVQLSLALILGEDAQDSLQRVGIRNVLKSFCNNQKLPSRSF